MQTDRIDTSAVAIRLFKIMVSQAGFEPATFPLGGGLKPYALLGRTSIYRKIRPVASANIQPYSVSCCHSAVTKRKE